MKILIVNFRFFISGGPERYLFNIINLLEANGHEVIPFSVKHLKNKASKYAEYFMEGIGLAGEIYAKDYKSTNNVILFLKLLKRFFYSFEAKKRLLHLIKHTKPDIIYVLHYKGLISPSIFDVAKKMGIPIVNRISDFSRICANNVLFDYRKNEICEKCIHGLKLNGIINKCSNNSYANSIIKVFALYVEKLMKLDSKTSAYVIPSEFTIKKFIEAGFNENKIKYIPTFYQLVERAGDDVVEEDGSVLLFGRLDPDKGVEFAINNFIELKIKLNIIGESSDPKYYEYLKSLVGDSKHIRLLGYMESKELSIYIQKCSLVIVPSLWYDNFPNVILEAASYKKPVLASNVGSLSYMIKNNENGMLFNRNDSFDFKQKLLEIFNNSKKLKLMGDNAFRILNTEYSEQQHYNKLIELFENLRRSNASN